jgi:large subunit ribosomal protein L1
LKLLEAIQKAKKEAPERKFTESVDLFINFKGVDFSKPENKLNLQVVMPNGRGKNRKICVICGDEMLSEAKKVATQVIKQEQIKSTNKKKIKKIADECDFFIAEAPLMPQVGKNFGQVLAPRGKMPRPVPPGAKLEPVIKTMEKTVMVKTKGKNMPVIHVPIGIKQMEDQELQANAQAVLNAVTSKLPQKENNIRSVLVKTTMGPTFKVEVWK